MGLAGLCWKVGVDRLKIWGKISLIRHALVCMSLLDLLLQIKITVSIGFSFINHCFLNTPHRLLESNPLVSIFFSLKPLNIHILAILWNAYSTLINSVKAGLGWLKLDCSPHLFMVWHTGPCHVTYIFWYSRRRPCYSSDTADWASLLGSFFPTFSPVTDTPNYQATMSRYTAFAWLLAFGIGMYHHVN